MLLRLRIQGFKNLRDVEIRFGPLTCFVGRNGVGKSNISDAIQFLRLLSKLEIQQAAEAIRSPAAGTFGPLDLFHELDNTGALRLEADLLVPERVFDDFGEEAVPATNLLSYSVEFRLVSDPRPRLALVAECLAPLRKADAGQVLGFPHQTTFRKSAVRGALRRGLFISTGHDDPAKGTRLQLHQDGGSRGRPVNPGNSPRTVLGGTNTKEYPTVLAARREMESWQFLHLEPSSLRMPDSMGADPHVTERGARVAATLRRLATSGGRRDVLAEAANRLAELVPEVERLQIDEDKARQQYVVQARLRGSQQWLGPRALSDGTLRFLALVTMQMDSEGGRLLCMEEPENGIHAGSAPAMVRLLRDYAVDADLPVGPDNPVRQVVLNSHSPDILRQLHLREVLFVESVRGPRGGAAIVAGVRGGWRDQPHLVTVDRLREVLGGAPYDPHLEKQLQLALPFPAAQR